MKLEVTEAVWVEELGGCSLDELVERSRLPEAVLRELMDCGVLEARDPVASTLTFDSAVLATAQTAARLRSDFELEVGGVALALALLRRIDALEAEVRRLSAAAAP